MGGMLLAIIISVGIPLSLFIYAILQKQWWPFILGVLAFVSSQVLFRIPLLQLLEAKSLQYTMFSMTQPILYAIFLAFSAGIVEEGARFLFMRFLLKERTWQTGFLFGAGHGGIEAILFVGINAIVLLFTSHAASLGTEFLIGGVERFFAIIFHISLSLFVLRAVSESRIVFLGIAILFHGAVNSLVGIVPIYFSESMSLMIIETSLAIVALLLFSYHLIQKRKGVFT